MLVAYIRGSINDQWAMKYRLQSDLEPSMVGADPECDAGKETQDGSLIRGSTPKNQFGGRHETSNKKELSFAHVHPEKPMTAVWSCSAKAGDWDSHKCNKHTGRSYK